MLKTGITALLLGTLLACGNANAQDPCRMVACMAGKVGGEYGNLDGSDCSGAVADFFSIVETGKHGVFRPDKTARSRLKALKKCPDQLAQNTNAVDSIISKFGRVRGL
ncbi:TrbM/KikA/MpfK family conjugal transfer protein [Escherichia coli]